MQAKADANAHYIQTRATQGYPTSLEVKTIDRLWVHIPYRERVARHMVRQNWYWNYFELIKVTLKSGIVGIGETMPFYTWSHVSDRAVQFALERSAAEIMWHDSLGPGLQQALFDAVGKQLGVPAYALLGSKIRDRAAVAWWAIDMPGEDWTEECKLAIQNGYTAFKTKARPWFDLTRQCEFLSSSLPEYFSISLDFNGTLRNTAQAIDQLEYLSRYRQVSMFEEPLPETDLEGYREVRKRISTPVAIHTRKLPAMDSGKLSMVRAVREDICDGFVLSYGGASAVIHQGCLAEAVDMPFWLQQVGTSITAAFSLHCAAVLPLAQWPAVNCHQIFEHTLVESDLKVQGGMCKIPKEPGLGINLNEEAVERFRAEPILQFPPPAVNQIIAIFWPSGATSYYGHYQQYWQDFACNRTPGYLEGVELVGLPNDGTPSWEEMQILVKKGPVHSAGRPLS